MSTEEPGLRLVRYARETIARTLGGPRPSRPSGAWFERVAASFVTLTRRGVLHGCMGSIEATHPLVDDVARNAYCAAFRDPRFEPFVREWLPDLGVEVSVLSPLEALSFTDEEDAIAQLVPHRDGLVLDYGPYRAAYLPHVWESLPDRSAFLAALKQKAGLPRGFWASAIALQRFTVHCWSEGPSGSIPAREAAP